MRKFSCIVGIDKSTASWRPWSEGREQSCRGWCQWGRRKYEDLGDRIPRNWYFCSVHSKSIHPKNVRVPRRLCTTRTILHWTLQYPRQAAARTSSSTLVDGSRADKGRSPDRKMSSKSSKRILGHSCEPETWGSYIPIPSWNKGGIRRWSQSKWSVHSQGRDNCRRRGCRDKYLMWVDATNNLFWKNEKVLLVFWRPREVSLLQRLIWHFKMKQTHKQTLHNSPPFLNLSKTD